MFEKGVSHVESHWHVLGFGPVVAAAESNGSDVGHSNAADDAGRGRPRPRRSGRRQGLVLLPRHGGNLVRDEDIVSDFD